MQIDLTAMLQGIYDARENHPFIPSEFIDRLIIAIDEISYPGPVKRPIVNYDELLEVLAHIEPENYLHLARLWEYLGNSISSGLVVANVDRAGARQKGVKCQQY